MGYKLGLTLAFAVCFSVSVAHADPTPAPQALAAFFQNFEGRWSGSGSFMQQSAWGWTTTSYRNRYTFTKKADGVWEAHSEVYPFNGPAQVGTTTFSVRGGDAFEAGQGTPEAKLDVLSASASAATIMSHHAESGTFQQIDARNELSFGTDGRFHGTVTYYRNGWVVATDNYEMDRTP